MKRYGDLYSSIVDPENILLAHENAQKGKRHYPAVVRVNNYQQDYLERLRTMMGSGEYQTSRYHAFWKLGCKKNRWIYKLPYFPDRIAHHCLVNVLEPVWSKVFIRDTYSALMRRGIHDGVRRMKGFMQDVKGAAYYLKMDVQKFYPSVDHDIMKHILRLKIKCKRTLSLLDEIIDSAVGLPIGNYLSQYLGNLYLAYFDHWVKEVLGAIYYSRYCDDMVLLSGSKAWLQEARVRIQEYLEQSLMLNIKPNWRVCPTFACGLDYLGYVFLGSHIRVRKDIAQRFKAKVNNIRKNYLRLPLDKVVSVLMSYYGWFRYADAANLWCRHVDSELLRIVYYVCDMNQVKVPRPLRSMA